MGSMRNIFERTDNSRMDMDSGAGVGPFSSDLGNPEKIAQQAMAARMGLLGRKRGSIR